MNAHGVGISSVDLAEARAFQRVFGARRPPVTALKGYMGNLASGCGAVELIGSLIGVNRGFIPPALNCDEPDPACAAGCGPLGTAANPQPDVRQHEPHPQRPGGGPGDSGHCSGGRRLIPGNRSEQSRRACSAGSHGSPGTTHRNPRKALMRRVVVTGMGMVTPVGHDLESTWASLLAGKSGVGPISLFDARTFPTRIAAEVKDFRLETIATTRAGGPSIRGTPVRPGRGTDGDGGFGAARDRARSWTDAGSASTWDRARASRIFPGSSSWCTRSTHDGRVDTAEFTRLGLNELHPIREAEQEPGTPSGHLASVFGAKGPNANCLTACAASSQAIGEASS